MNFDWIPKIISLCTKAPDTFLVALAFGVIIGILWKKREADNAKSAADSAEKSSKLSEKKLHELESNLEEKANYISSFEKENNQLKIEASKASNPFFPGQAEYEDELSKYSDSDLGREALILARKMETELNAAKKRQEPRISAGNPNGPFDSPLYNKWMIEGEKMLVIKRIILKQLKTQISETYLDSLDVLLDSHYSQKICDVDSVQEAVNEIRQLGSKIKEL
jgi:hypothetical protein